MWLLNFVKLFFVSVFIVFVVFRFFSENMVLYFWKRGSVLFSKIFFRFFIFILLVEGVGFIDL